MRSQKTDRNGHRNFRCLDAAAAGVIALMERALHLRWQAQSASPFRTSP